MTTNGAVGLGPVVPLFRCRTCGIPAVRYTGGKRRTFYCAQHGPTKLADWSRLLPIPSEEYEFAGRLLSLAPPLPARIARLLDGLSDGLRDALAQDLPAASVADMQAVTALEAEVARLTEENARLTVELASANEIALEAMAMWPVPVGDAAQPTPSGGIATWEPHPPRPTTERDFAPPTLDPKPRTPGDVATFPSPEEPAPKKKGKGYTITPPATPIKLVEEDDEPLPVVPGGFTPTAFSNSDLDLLGFDVLVRTLKVGPHAPGLGITRRAVKDYGALSTANKRAVLQAIEFLGMHPENLREEHLFGFDNPPLYALRANRKIRLICTKGGGIYGLQRIVDRHSKIFYRNER